MLAVLTIYVKIVTLQNKFFLRYCFVYSIKIRFFDFNIFNRPPWPVGLQDYELGFHL